MPFTLSLPEQRLDALIAKIDIPLSYYEKAVQRYRSLLKWFKRNGSAIAQFDPAVYPQGSFRLGTVIRPLLPDEEYDLDIVCHLVLLGKTELTQRQLKELVGSEVKAYAKANGIESPVEEGKRTWRLDYADDVNFHIDILPCVPEDKQTIDDLIQRFNIDPFLAESAVALTCKTHAHYSAITSDWPTSNPIGYGNWFELRMKERADQIRSLLVKEGKYEKEEDVPTYALKSTLQRVVQLLKRHRDSMFQEVPELKPISMIITTLAAEAYNGEPNLRQAMRHVLEEMPNHVRALSPRIPNPVDPGEDFANKWTEDLALEHNFWLWHKQACVDFGELEKELESGQFQKIAEDRFELGIPSSEAMALTRADTAQVHVSPTIIVNEKTSAAPWSSRHG